MHGEFLTYVHHDTDGQRMWTAHHSGVKTLVIITPKGKKYKQKRNTELDQDGNGTKVYYFGTKIRYEVVREERKRSLLKTKQKSILDMRFSHQRYIGVNKEMWLRMTLCKCGLTPLQCQEN